VINFVGRPVLIIDGGTPVVDRRKKDIDQRSTLQAHCYNKTLSR